MTNFEIKVSPANLLEQYMIEEIGLEEEVAETIIRDDRFNTEPIFLDLQEAFTEALFDVYNTGDLETTLIDTLDKYDEEIREAVANYYVELNPFEKF